MRKLGSSLCAFKQEICKEFIRYIIFLLMSSKNVVIWKKKIKYVFQMLIYKANTNSLPDQTKIKVHMTLDDI